MDDFLSTEVENEKEADVKKRRPFAIWEVGDKEYKLKLNSENIAKLEDKYKKNLLLLVSDEGLPPLTVMLTILQAAMLPYNHGIRLADMYKIFDEYVEKGGDQTKLLADVIFPTLSVSGFFTEDQSEEMEERLKDLSSPL